MNTTTEPSAPLTADMERVTCQGCKRVGEFHRVAQDGSAFTETARVAGWRIWDGATLGGQPQSVRFCPVCAGTATPEQEVALLGYKAGCHTCGADMVDESDEPDDYVFTEADAQEWARDHRCEPDTYITKPAGAA